MILGADREKEPWKNKSSSKDWRGEFVLKLCDSRVLRGRPKQSLSDASMQHKTFAS